MAKQSSRSISNAKLGAEGDTPLAWGYLPLAQQAAMGVSGLPHSREAGRQLMITVQSFGRYPGDRGTGASKIR